MAEQILRDFLEKRRVDKTEIHNYTSKSTGDLPNQKGWSSGSYYVADKDRVDFLTAFCNAIKKGAMPTLTEKPNPFGPLRVDFDFEAPLEAGQKRQYTDDMLRDIVGFYQNEIRNITIPEEFSERMLYCIVLEKEAPRVERGLIKDGFHLHFPHFTCTEYVQDVYLVNKVTEAMIECGTWDDCKIVTKVANIIDRPMWNKPWMMYGSVNYKGPHSRPYLYNRWDDVPEKKQYGHVFNQNGDEITMTECFSESHPQVANNVRFHLPKLLSIIGHKRSVEFIPSVAQSSARQRTRKRRQIPIRRREEVVIADLKEIREVFLGMLSLERSDETKTWFEVGHALFDIGQGKDEALELWIEFSRRSAKFKEGECAEKWDAFQPGDRTIGSIKRWACMDSVDAYNEWKRTCVRHYVFESLHATQPKEWDIAQVVNCVAKDRYVCVDSKREIWYEFFNGRYVEMSDGLSIKQLLMNEVLPIYTSTRAEMLIKVAEVDERLRLMNGGDDETTNKLKQNLSDVTNKAKKCLGVIERLKEAPFHDRVVKMCKLDMCKPDFRKYRDENKQIFGCENGVLDLKNLCFREGSPDDYRTFTNGLFYRTFREDDEEVKEFNKYFEKVYPNPERRQYFYDFFSGCLEGGNQNKNVLFMIGGKDGAKSMTTSMLELAFGTGDLGYMGKFPRELFVQATGRNSSAQCRPELARIRGKRIMATQEVTQREKFNLGFLNEISGNDSMYIRDAYEKGNDIRPQHTTIAQMNTAPRVEGNDPTADAFWSRTKFLDHESKFIKPQDKEEFAKIPKTEEEQMKQKTFPADPDFALKLPELAQVLIWKLFENYKRIRKNKETLKEPACVSVSSLQQQSQQDVYLQFKNTRLVKVTNEAEVLKAQITYEQLKATFDEFIAEEFPYHREKIGKTAFLNVVAKYIGRTQNPKEKHYGVGPKSRVYGYKIINPDADESEDEEEEEEPKPTATSKGKGVKIC